MFERDEHHFPLKRLLVLGALVGAGAYYLSREQNRKALDAKLAELGLKDAAQDVGSSVTKGWEKTKDAAQNAGAAVADKAADLKEDAAKLLDQAKDKASDLADAAKDKAQDVAQDVKAGAAKAADAAQDKAAEVKQDAAKAVDKAQDKAQQTKEEVDAKAKSWAFDLRTGADTTKQDTQDGKKKL